MPLSQEMLALFALRAATVCIGISYLASMSKLFAYPSTYPAAHVVISTVTLTVAVLWCLSDCRRPGRTLGSIVFVVVATLHCVAYLRWNTPVPGTGYPALHAVIVSSLLMAPVAFGPRRGVPVVVALSVMLAGERVAKVGILQSIGEAGVFAVTGIAGCVLYYLLKLAVTRMERASARTWLARERAAVEERRAMERERWDRLIHDKVLGALRLAGTGRLDKGAQNLAAEALAGIDGRDGEPIPALAEEIPAIAARAGLTLTMSGEVTVDDAAVRAALLSATEQAMANVRQHSGQDTVAVSLARDGTDESLVSVVIADPGRGFGPDQIRADRRGLSQGIVGALGWVGGMADISSTPGAGTRVRLSVRDRSAGSTEAGGLPNLRIFAPMIGIGALSLGAHIFIAALHLESVRSVAVSVLCMILIPVLSFAVAVVPARARYVVPMALAMSTIPFVLTVNLRNPTAGNWDTWYVGAMLAFIGTVTFRFSPAWGAASVALTGGGSALAQGLIGEVNWTELWTSLPPLVAMVIAGTVTRRGLDATAAYVTEATAEQGRLAIEEAAAQARTLETEARSAALRRDVAPMLRRLTTAGHLDESERRRCLELEAAARDQLVAAPLMDERFAEQVLDARRRDVDVEIASSGPVPERHAAVFRRVAVAVLTQAQARSRAVLLWRPRPSGVLATVTLIDDEPQHDDVATAVRRALADQGDALDAALTDDEDAIQVQLRATDLTMLPRVAPARPTAAAVGG